MATNGARAARVVLAVLLLCALCTAVAAEEGGAVCYFPAKLLGERMPSAGPRDRAAYAYVSMYPAPMKGRPLHSVAVLSIRSQRVASKGGAMAPLWDRDGRLSPETAASLTSHGAVSLEIGVDALHELTSWRAAAEAWWKRNTYWEYSPVWAHLRPAPWTCRVYVRDGKGGRLRIGEAPLEAADDGQRTASVSLGKTERARLLSVDSSRDLMIVVTLAFRAQFAHAERIPVPVKLVSAPYAISLPPLAWLKQVDRLPTHALCQGPLQRDAIDEIAGWVGRAAASQSGHPLRASQGYTPDALGAFLAPYLEDAVELISSRTVPRIVRVFAGQHILMSVNRDIFRERFQADVSGLTAAIRALLVQADRELPDDGLTRAEFRNDAAGLALRIADGVRIPAAAIDARSGALATNLQKLLADVDDPSRQVLAIQLKKLGAAGQRLAAEGLRDKRARKFWATAHAAFRGDGGAFNQGSKRGLFHSPLREGTK